MSALRDFYIHYNVENYDIAGINRYKNNANGGNNLIESFKKQKAINDNIMNNLISVKISDLELFKQRIIGLNNTNYRKNLRTYYQNYTTTKPINDFIEEVNKRVNQYLINRNIFSGRAYKEIKLNLNEVEQEINLKELLRIKTKLESALFTLTNNLQVGKPIRSTTIRAIHRHYNEIINMIVGYNNKSKKTLLSGFLSEIVKNSKKGNYKQLIEIVQSLLDAIPISALTTSAISGQVGEATAAACDDRMQEAAKETSYEHLQQLLLNMKGTDRVFLQQSRTSTKNSSNVTNEKINILKQRYGIEIITSTTEDKVDNVILLNDTPYNITAKQYSKDFFKKEKGFHLQTVKLLDTLSSNYIDFDFLNHWLNLWSLTPNGRMPNGKSTNYKSTIVNQENRNKANELIYFLMKYQALIYGNILKDMGTNISQIFMGFVEDTPYIYTVKDLMINPNVKWKFTPQLNQLNLMGYNKFVKGNKNDKIISLIHQRINKILSAIDTKTIQVTIDPTHLS